MKERVVKPEILDELPPDDPAALRSRRDLRRVNAVMGNYRWIARQVAEFRDDDIQWVELGAGDGQLAGHLGCDELVAGLDFAPRPADWPSGWKWRSGDLFETLPDFMDSSDKKVGVIANLFLHHFSGEQLTDLGKILGDRASILIFSEPARYFLHRMQGYLATPLINGVTRHDMQVSIEAGFREDELEKIMRLGEKFGSIHTSQNLLGAYRLKAVANRDYG